MQLPKLKEVPDVEYINQQILQPLAAAGVTVDSFCDVVAHPEHVRKCWSAGYLPKLVAAAIRRHAALARHTPPTNGNGTGAPVAYLDPVDSFRGYLRDNPQVSPAEREEIFREFPALRKEFTDA